MKSFGEKLKELRIEKGLSQKELADLVDTSQSAIFYWENNQQEPKISSLKNFVYF